MFEIKGLDIGDRVMVIYHERSYSSVVQDKPAPDTIVIAQPTSMGIYLDLISPDEGEILFHKENGLMTFQVVQEDRFSLDGVRMLRLRQVSEVKRSQRRSFYRLEKSLPVRLAICYDDGSDPEPLAHKARTINISGGGLKIAIKHPIDNGTKLECKVSLGTNIELLLKGQVVWVERPTSGDKTYTIGLQFSGEDPLTQRQLINYVMNEQRRQLQKNR